MSGAQDILVGCRPIQEHLRVQVVCSMGVVSVSVLSLMLSSFDVGGEDYVVL